MYMYVQMKVMFTNMLWIESTYTYIYLVLIHMLHVDSMEELI